MVVWPGRRVQRGEIGSLPKVLRLRYCVCVNFLIGIEGMVMHLISYVEVIRSSKRGIGDEGRIKLLGHWWLVKGEKCIRPMAGIHVLSP